MSNAISPAFDGITATTATQKVMNFSPSIDAIEEFKVQTSSYSAEYGQSNGAIVQVAFKGGTNQFRGTMYEFLRNDKLAAKDYFLNFQLPPGSRTMDKSRLRRNQFGSFLSGPVYVPGVYNGRDRTFWSFSYEGWRQTQENVREGYWFPQSFRNGDFSALLTPPIRDGKPIRAPIIIYDPTTGEPFTDLSGRITNIIPPSRINKNAQNFINKYQPLPMFVREDPLENNVLASVPDIILSNQYMFRVDHNFGPNDKVFARYLTDRAHRDDHDLNPNFTRLHDMQPTNLALQWVHIFDPRLLNEFRFGTNYQYEKLYNPRTGTDFDLDSLGIGRFRVVADGNRKLTGAELGLPTTIIGGDRDVSWTNLGRSNTFQYTDNLVIVRGVHSFKTGFEFRRPSNHGGSSNDPRGRITGGEGGYSLAGWLLGYPSNTQTPEGNPYYENHQNRWSTYFLDDWKVGRKLTVNAGLRWDFFQVTLDRTGHVRNLRLDILSTGADGRKWPTMIPAPGTKNVALYNGYNRYFMPRIGLAFRATEKWVIRSGFGWFVDPGHIGSPGLLVRNPPFGGTFSFNQVTDSARVISYSYGGQTYNIPTRKFRPGAPILSFDNAFPGVDPASIRANVLLIPPDNRYTNNVQWSLDIQRALPWNTFLTVAYVGSKTSHIDNSIDNFNNPDPSPDTDINRRRAWQGYVSEGEGDRVRLLGGIRYMDCYTDGSYHGLQTTVEKRYSSGLTMGLSYVYSKSLGEGYERNGGIPFQNPRDRRSDRERYRFDVTHNAVINYVYEMPFLRRFRGAAGALIGGWQTNGIITLRTGFPFGVTGGNLNTGSATRPDRITDGRISNPTRQKYFDPTAFRRTDCNIPGRLDLCHYGNAGPNILVSPGAHTFDLSMYKNWRISPLGDSGRLQFRAEFFNAFNTPQFGQPNGIGFTAASSIVPDAPRQGEVRSLRLPMRIIQFGLKLYF